MNIEVIIPTDVSFDEIMKDQINSLALAWLIKNSIFDRYDGSAKNMMTRACILANIYKEELKVLYDEAVSKSIEKKHIDKPKKVKGE